MNISSNNYFVNYSHLGNFLLKSQEWVRLVYPVSPNPSQSHTLRINHFMQHMSLMINNQATLPCPLSCLLASLSILRDNLNSPFLEQCSQYSNKLYLRKFLTRTYSLTPCKGHEMIRSIYFDFFLVKILRARYFGRRGSRRHADEAARIPGKRIGTPIFWVRVDSGYRTMDSGMRWENICLTINFESVFLWTSGFYEKR